MKKTIIGILLLILIVAVVGCGGPQFVCPDGETVVSDKAMCPAPKEDVKDEPTVTEPAKVEQKEGTVPAKPVEKAEETVVAPVTGAMDEDLKKILDRIDKVTSYEFIYQYGTAEVMKYTVVGDKVKASFIPGNPMYDKYGYYDRVLMDTREKTAVIYCVERSACDLEDKKVAKNIPYEDFEMPVDPVALVKSITYAEITGELTCDGNKPCTVIKFREDGQQVEIHVDNYYGFPYYWKKGDVEKKLTGVVYMPRDPQMALPAEVEEII